MSRRGLLKAAGGLLAAALLLAAFLMGLRLGQRASPANAEELLRAALHAHGDPIERVYAVREDRSGRAAGFALPASVRVATQGDRFWVEMDRGERRWAWGSDPDGAIWMTLGPHRALRIEPAEAGVPLQDLRDIYSLQPASLLENVLKDCRLEHTADTVAGHVITATPTRRRPSWMRSLTLEVDRETRAIRRLVLYRSSATTTFELVEARTADASLYRPEGHLREPYEILSRATTPDPRRAILVARFGPEAALWIRNP